MGQVNIKKMIFVAVRNIRYILFHRHACGFRLLFQPVCVVIIHIIPQHLGGRRHKAVVFKHAVGGWVGFYGIRVQFKQPVKYIFKSDFKLARVNIVSRQNVPHKAVKVGKQRSKFIFDVYTGVFGSVDFIVNGILLHEEEASARKSAAASSFFAIEPHCKATSIVAAASSITAVILFKLSFI